MIISLSLLLTVNCEFFADIAKSYSSLNPEYQAQGLIHCRTRSLFTKYTNAYMNKGVNTVPRYKLLQLEDREEEESFL